MKTKDVLNLKIDNSNFDVDMTIRDYLKKLLTTIWSETVATKF